MAATAKKRNASKSKTSAAKKKSARSVSKKASAKKSTSVNSVKSSKEVTAGKLKKFNIFSAVSFALFAALSIVFMSKDTVSANLPYAAKDAFASATSTVFGPAYKMLAEVEIRYILAFIFGLSAIFSLLLATRLSKKYETQVAGSVSVLRWIFTSISLGLILELTTKLTFVDSIITLKMVGALVLVTGILWIMSEQQNKGVKGKTGAFYLSLFTLFLAVMPLLVSLIASGIYGMERFGWHVYALAAVVVAGFVALALSQNKVVKKGLTAKGYWDLEGKYLSVDYLMKFSVFIIFLIAFFK